MTDQVPELLIELDPPIVLHDKEVHEVALREPTCGEMISALQKAGNGPDADLKMVQSLIVSVSGLQIQAVEKLPIRKFKQAVTYLMSFTTDGPATTES